MDSHELLEAARFQCIRYETRPVLDRAGAPVPDP